MSSVLYSCRSCGKRGLQLILSLGNMPLANALLTEEQLSQPEPTYPLDLVYCPSCTLVQITETVPPEVLFREYTYFSSFSDTMLEHAQQLVQHLIATLNLSSESLVVELASNDGYLLQFFLPAGIPVLGIEPASNVAEVARKKGIPTINEFFDKQLALQLRQQGKQADVIIANNVLAHVADLHGFVEGIRMLLKPDGTAVFEVAYVKDMIDADAFDQIYHEHLCYYSLTALNRLLESHQLRVVGVEKIPTHGGSLRVYVQHYNGASPDSRVEALLREEQSWGVHRFASYKSFAERVQQRRQNLVRLLQRLKADGHRLAGYGAAAKGTVLLNYFRIGKDLIDFIVDRNPHKQGRYVPGVRLPIYDPSKLLEEMPDYTLILAWNWAEEIIKQQSEYRQRGGRFILPAPSVKIIEIQ